MPSIRRWPALALLLMSAAPQLSVAQAPDRYTIMLYEGRHVFDVREVTIPTHRPVVYDVKVRTQLARPGTLRGVSGSLLLGRLMPLPGTQLERIRAGLQLHPSNGQLHRVTWQIQRTPAAPLAGERVGLSSETSGFAELLRSETFEIAVPSTQARLRVTLGAPL